MDRAIEIWAGETGAHRFSKVVQSVRHRRTLWTGILYVITIIVVVAVVATLQ